MRVDYPLVHSSSIHKFEDQLQNSIAYRKNVMKRNLMKQVIQLGVDDGCESRHHVFFQMSFFQSAIGDEN